MMQDAIRDFAKQFTFEPEIQNAENWKKHDKFVVCGMGGSNLASGLLKTLNPELDIISHNDYDLPKNIDGRLVIASSYSGNTEEVLSAYDEAREQGLPLAAIAVGAKLGEKAQNDGVPYVELKDTGIQPRSALGFSFRAMAKLMGLENILNESAKLATTLKPDELESQGKQLAETLKDHVPVIYASTRNRSIAYNWKIKLNETGKIPAFMNVIPEHNHNEVNSFDPKEKSRRLSELFHFIILRDSEDHPRNQKRMDVIESLLKDRNLPVTNFELTGDPYTKMFTSLIIGDWTAVYSAELYGHEAEQVPIIEEFKKKIAS